MVELNRLRWREVCNGPMEEVDVRHFVFALLISAAAMIIAPTGAIASVRHATTTASRRVYDPYRRDYHVWTRAENRAYRSYLAERHRAYVAYQRQRLAERRAYWRWRHERAERIEHERR